MLIAEPGGLIVGSLAAVCTENLHPDVVVMKSAKGPRVN
jgi:hypothetical protein